MIETEKKCVSILKLIINKHNFYMYLYSTPQLLNLCKRSTSYILNLFH